jgi:hypothetical protein
MRYLMCVTTLRPFPGLTIGSSLTLRINVLRPFIHRRDRMNVPGLGRGQRLEKLQHGLIIFGLDNDVVGMFRDCHIGAQDLGPFFCGEIPFCPKVIEHGSAFITSSGAILRCVRPMGYKEHPVAVHHRLHLFGTKYLLFPSRQALCRFDIATNQGRHTEKNRHDGERLEEMYV